MADEGIVNIIIGVYFMLGVTVILAGERAFLWLYSLIGIHL